MLMIGFRHVLRHAPLSIVASILFVCVILSLPASTAVRADSGRLTIIEDNDGLLPDGWDRHYTQGAMLSYLSPTLSTEDFASTLYGALSAHLPSRQSGIIPPFRILMIVPSRVGCTAGVACFRRPAAGCSKASMSRSAWSGRML